MDVSSAYYASLIIYEIFQLKTELNEWAISAG